MPVVAAVVVVITGIILLLTYYRNIDPMGGGFSPKCMFHSLTGWDCPGCGSQRAFHAIANGHWSEAWHFNPFVFFAVPVAAAYIIIESGRNLWQRLHKMVCNIWIVGAIFILALGWGIIRNL